ncbi:hypothetical protein [Paraburkholderia diazotrophica]|uniref:Uncharacterized protein n=1 Tax=Paraburkholderia diazotrophica TaxID=667676 RepID=A0A1H7E9Q9_9BURK|nr:hypothetical protein [Paraburkholderia diazotrophica]SEK10629.1 hypothetical protein SAMN05192539_104851 [Paraburkholderia diazotrophica]
MNDTDHDLAAVMPRVMRALRTSTITTTIAVALAGCGGGGTDGTANAAAANNAVINSAGAAVSNSAAHAGSANHQVVPRYARFERKTYRQWVVSFWQWVNMTDNGPFFPNPLINCTRPISAGQSGNLWYWATPSSYFHALSVPNAPQTCDQSANVIPAGTSILLATLDTFSSTLLPPGAYTATTAADERVIADRFADRIQDLFVTIDNVPVADVTAYRVRTDQFTFKAALRWVFGLPEHNYGTGTAVADGYYLILKPLPTGSHTIHYGGRFHYLAGDFGPGAPPPDYVVDITLMITVGP